MHGCGKETITVKTHGGRWIAATQRHLQEKGDTTRRLAHKRRRVAARRRGFWNSRQGLRFLQKKVHETKPSSQTVTCVDSCAARRPTA
jgi:hypothetical protein